MRSIFLLTIILKLFIPVSSNNKEIIAFSKLQIKLSESYRNLLQSKSFAKRNKIIGKK